MSNSSNQNPQNSQNDQSRIFQLETLLNSKSDWENNPIESTRQSIKRLLSIIKSQQSNIYQLDRVKASKTELSSSLNIKANIADIMRTFSEVAANMDNRPTMDDIQLLLNEKVSREEIVEILASKTSIEEVKGLLSSGALKLNMKNNYDELTENFITKVEFREILETKANKENVANALYQKANKEDIENIIKNTVNISEYHIMKNKLEKEIENANNIKNQSEYNSVQEIKNISKRIDDIDQDIDRLIENIKRQFQNVNNVLNNLTTNKADYKELEAFMKKTNDVLNINKIYNDIITKVENTLYENMSKLKGEIGVLISSIDEKIKKDLQLSNKNTSQQIDKISNDINANKNYINQEILKVNNVLSTTTNQKDFTALTQKINQLISQVEQRDALLNNQCNNNQQYATLNDFESFFKSIQKELNNKFEEVQLYTQDYLKNFDNDIQEILVKKANISDISNILSTKADTTAVKTAIDNKVSQTEYETMKLSLEKIISDFQDKIDSSKFNEFANNTSLTIEEIQRDLMMKANIKEMISYLNNKANIDDVNKALTAIHGELDTKSSIDEFKQRMNNQDAINNVVCKVNSVGQWIWNSGQVKNGYAVPWEEQCINTSPENFIWEKDKTNITVIEKGIYLMSIAFFVKDKPAIQILVNGNNVLSVVNGNCFVVRHDEGSSKSLGNNSIEEEFTSRNENGSITGMTLMDFINLGENARVTVSYSGSDNVKGFMSLQKVG